MKRIALSLVNALKLVIPSAATLEAIAEGIIAYKENKTFYAYVGERSWLWITILILIGISILSAFFFSYGHKYPGRKLKELSNLCDNWIYIFPTDKELERDSVVEIRKELGKRGGSVPFAIASIDRIDDNHKSAMLLQHAAIYDDKQNRYIDEPPQNDIKGKQAKPYFYRPYLSRKEFDILLRRGDNGGNP